MLLVVSEKDADAGMRRRQSRRVAGLLRQFQLLGKCFHGDRVFAFVAIRPPKQNQGVGCLCAVARRLVELQRRLEMRDGLIEAALLGTQAAKGEAGPCFQSSRLVLARKIQSLLQGTRACRRIRPAPAAYTRGQSSRWSPAFGC